MKKHTLRLLAVSAAYFALHPAFAAEGRRFPGGSAATEVVSGGVGATGMSAATTAGASGALPASRIASRFESLAGSPENAASLVTGLRSGSEITLTATDATTGLSFTPATRPMGYGNITRALSLAQRQLAAQGITEPTPEQLQLALNGGTVTTIDAGGASQTVEVPGVLQLRSEGMGWGQIAHQLSVSPGRGPAATALPARSVAPVAASQTALVQGSAAQRGGSYHRGAIVSGDGAIMQGRMPGYAAAGESRGAVSGKAAASANAKAAAHARLPLVQAGSTASLGNGYAAGTTGGHGKGGVNARSGGRF